jgi:hypothetical protein
MDTTEEAQTTQITGDEFLAAWAVLGPWLLDGGTPPGAAAARAIVREGLIAAARVRARQADEAHRDEEHG